MWTFQAIDYNQFHGSCSHTPDFSAIDTEFTASSAAAARDGSCQGKAKIFKTNPTGLTCCVAVNPDIFDSSAFRLESTHPSDPSEPVQTVIYIYKYEDGCDSADDGTLTITVQRLS